ncbi:MAG TPA: homocysteine biosynthesis protein [Spirochaetota bacterium]|nr:homocysteine biosynthesis protein [Spirochaetota bacterium]
MSTVEIKKSYEEINDKIKKGKAVVVTAEEMPDIVKNEGVKKAFEQVDVVTTGTFGVMCSSGAFLNFGHTKPKIRASKVWLNDVEAYGGIAAVDCYLGATQVKEDDPLNMVYPGSFSYGGGHVIEDLIAGRQVKLKAKSYGTDCYPLKDFEKTITIKDLRNATLYNPRNCYQNYNVAINLSNRIKYTYMGILKPDMGNITYSSAGQLSPLLNDPYYWTIGTGTKIFLAGALGAVTWHGTQHDPDSMRDENGMVSEGAGTLSVCGNMKEMNTEFIRGASLTGYGCSLMMGIGIPIPILNEELAFFTGLTDRDIKAQIIDYGIDYPDGNPRSVKEITYADLKSGSVEINGRNVPTAPLSSYSKARKIASVLKDWVENGFTIGVPQIPLPTIPYSKK